MKALLGIRKHLCVIPVVPLQTQERHRDARQLYYKRQTFDNRYRRLIERWKKEGKSNREITSLLGKVPQTIHTEIKRGTVRQCLGKGRFKAVYSTDYAQQSYENNRKRSVKKSSMIKTSGSYPDTDVHWFLRFLSD